MPRFALFLRPLFLNDIYLQAAKKSAKKAKKEAKTPEKKAADDMDVEEDDKVRPRRVNKRIDASLCIVSQTLTFEW